MYTAKMAALIVEKNRTLLPDGALFLGRKVLWFLEKANQHKLIYKTMEL